MIRKRINILLLLICLSVSTPLLCIHDSLINRLELEENARDFIHKKNGEVKINLTGYQSYNWLFFPYDQFHKIDLRDSGFTVVSRPEFDITKVKFTGCGWFKFYFKVPPEFVKRPFIFQFNQIGATEFYTDGRISGGYGKIYNSRNADEPHVVKDANIPMIVGDTLTHCLMIRFSLFDFDKYHKRYGARVFGLNNTAFTSSFREDASSTPVLLQKIFYMLGAFFFALFHLHFFIFFQYREKTIHLYYSGFLMFLSLSFFIPFAETLITSPGMYYLYNTVNSFFFPTCCFFLISLLYKLFDLKYNWNFWLFSSIYLCSIISIFLNNDAFRAILILYTYFSSIIISVRAIRRKLNGAKFLGWGVLSVTVHLVLGLLGLIIASEIRRDDIDTISEIILIISFIGSILSIPVFMSAYLAYDFATVNKNLKKQMLANQELSLEKQEILSNQNKLLELQVNERTKEIATQNKTLEHQKKEITDSINYARRIQQALLPDLDTIQKALPESFVLYMPKDIVSGDFYFFHDFTEKGPGKNDDPKNDPEYIIAAADCTGHGVPGALMSMIVHEKLVYAMKKYNEPAQILKMINQKVKDSLKQHMSEGSSRDGCDIALCKITKDTLSYSGANRPLFVYYKNGEFAEIKATKTAIAGFTSYDQEFEQTNIPIKDLTAVYLFSDGFADQFGGEKSKKITTKRFRELLGTFIHLPVKEQKDLLASFYEGWRGKLDQIDDVLVIGIKF